MIWETLGKQIAILPPTTFTNFISIIESNL